MLERMRPWVLAAVVVACVAISVAGRARHRADWVGPDAPNVVAGEPLLTTFDAYRWTRWAREHREGRFEAGELDALRAHPRQRMTPASLPLPSRILAWAAPWTGDSVYRAGFVLVPLLASLFVVPLVLYGVRIGYPAAGVLGALTGGFASEYFTRTSLGRVDTDALNLFFPWLASYLILVMDAHASRRRLLALAVALGATLAIFEAWYGRPGFALVYGGVLALRLVTERVKLGRPVLALSAGLGVLALTVGPWRLDRAVRGALDFTSAYLGVGAGAASGPAVDFPPVMDTIREAHALPTVEMLGLLLSVPWLSALGLVGFLGLVLARPRGLLPMAPIVALGALSFVSGRRFMIFLAPLVGMGLGFLLSVGIDLLRRRPRDAFRADRRDPVLAPALAFGVFLVVLLPLTGHDRKPTPILQPPVFESLDRLATLLPPGARIWSWWDTGYAITDLTGAATFHDGGSQRGLQTYLVARSLIDPRPQALPGVAAHLDGLDRKGMRRLRRSYPEPERAFEEMATRGRFSSNDGLFVLFTADMIRKFGAMHAIGSWTSSEGAGWINGFNDHGCHTLTRERIACTGGDVHLATGRIEGSDRRLRRVLFVSGGRAVRQWQHDAGSPLTLEVLLDAQGRMFAAYLIDEVVFASGFHQMFMLGHHDPDRFEEVLNDFPWARVFRVRPPPFRDGFESGDASAWSGLEAEAGGR